MVWYSHLLKNFPKFVVIHTIKAFSVLNEAEVDFFLEFSCFFYDPTKIMASGPITLWEIDGETVETVPDFIFWAPKSLQIVTAAMKLKEAYSLKEKL